MRLNTHILTTVVSLGLGLAQAQQGSNFNVSPEIAEKYGCNPQCQALIAQGNAADLAKFGTNFDFDFYATAGNFSGSQPGDVLKMEPVANHKLDVLAGTTVFKMQYTSKDIDGTPVPVSGFIAFPFAKTSKPFDLIAFGHGTSGVFRGCTPSSIRNLYSMENLRPLLLEGYAIVATDYAGLGNNATSHKYLANAAHANDLVYAAMAAGKAFPSLLSQKWAAVGHSQGGGAVWKLSEHPLVQDAESGYVGGVALAPAAPRLHILTQTYLAMVQNITDPFMVAALAGSSIQAVIGISHSFPDYDPLWLADEIKQRIELAKIGEYCDLTIVGADLPLDKIFTEFDISGDQVLAEFEKINAPGQGDRANKPLLIVQGHNDVAVPLPATEYSFEQTCVQKNSAQLTVYPGLDHSSILSGSSIEWMGFLRKRFAGAPSTRCCNRSVIEPVNLEYAQLP